jgi:methylenetetrahydrofolate dehydrogenase (NADP+)/methenyltetrahydrofolate cyclohydrolase
LPADLIDGAQIARSIRDEVKEAAHELIEKGTRPGLAVVLVGDDAASIVYVRSKTKACDDAGMHSVTIRLDAATSQSDLLHVVKTLNEDPFIHGILVQMPLPKHLDADEVIRTIDPRKDVDGFHPENVGRLSTGSTGGFVPCTPAGVMELLKRSGVSIAGAEAVVVGRSNIVGKPMAALLIAADATVTVCHSRTRDLASHVSRADIVIAAVGRAGLIRGEMLKPGAVVIDVGMNRFPDSSVARGYKLVGDVDFESAREVASKITPVPGGVGPMTIAMLLANTIRAARALA